MVRKHYYDFRYLANMLKIRSHVRDHVHTVMLIKFSKQVPNSFAKIINVYKDKFKRLPNI